MAMSQNKETKPPMETKTMEAVRTQEEKMECKLSTKD